MPTTELTRGEVLAELARLKAELNVKTWVTEALELHCSDALKRLDVLIERVEGKCESSPDDWYTLTPVQAQVMNAMSHLSDAQEIGGYPSHEHEQINEAKRHLMPLLDKQETDSGKG